VRRSAPAQKLSPWLPMTRPRKPPSAGEGGDGLGSMVDRAVVEDVHLAAELEAGDAVAEVDEAGGVVAWNSPTRPCGASRSITPAGRRQRAVALPGTNTVRALGRPPYQRASFALLFERRKRRRRSRAPWPRAARRPGDAGGVHEGERAELPAVAPAIASSISLGVSQMRRGGRRVVEEREVDGLRRNSPARPRGAQGRVHAGRGRGSWRPRRARGTRRAGSRYSRVTRSTPRRPCRPCGRSRTWSCRRAGAARSAPRSPAGRP
jgi:hypothetical protein